MDIIWHFSLSKTKWFAKKRVIYLFPFYRIDIISLVSKTLQGFRSIWRNRNTKTILCIRVRCFENLSRQISLKKTKSAEYAKHTSTTCPCWRRAAETASPPSPAPTTATLRGVPLSKAMIGKESKLSSIVLTERDPFICSRTTQKEAQYMQITCFSLRSVGSTVTIGRVLVNLVRLENTFPPAKWLSRVWHVFGRRKYGWF